jgi:TonB family protein
VAGKIVGYLVIAITLGAIAVSLGLFSKPASSSDATRPNVAEDIPASKKPPVYPVNREFRIGYWSYQVNDGRWMPAIPTIGNRMELADAVFMVLDVTARNEDRSPSALPNFKLIDTEGREYHSSPKGKFMRSLFGVPVILSSYTDVNPGVSKRGNLVFDVPQDRAYLLQVSGGIRSGQFALVTLVPPSPKSDASDRDLNKVQPQTDQSGDAAAQPAVPIPTSDSAPSGPLPQYSIGQQFTVGYFSYLVTDASVEQGPHGNVLAVSVNLRNEDSGSSMIPMLELLNEGGDVAAHSIVEIGQSGSLGTELASDLKPGRLYRGYGIFEVPTDHQYTLRVSGGLTSGRKALVLLARAGSPASEGVYKVGGGVSAPSVLYKVDPEYSEEARKAKYSGTVLISVVVDANGKAQNIKVVRSLGLGLDEKAMEAVAKWKFKPGMKNGQPVSVQATIEVNFRLLNDPAR